MYFPPLCQLTSLWLLDESFWNLWTDSISSNVKSVIKWYLRAKLSPLGCNLPNAPSNRFEKYFDMWFSLLCYCRNIMTLTMLGYWIEGNLNLCSLAIFGTRINYLLLSLWWKPHSAPYKLSINGICVTGQMKSSLQRRETSHCFISELRFGVFISLL